ncbi:hypothetical protein GXP70_18035 [Paenibacillus lycopersici]|uniref:Uncharacterized protein n=1 Tax=Paenibacillus lycopersici TaxID=2704462 RepID=A0A6C0G2W9_9BACL|nr:hypothetical protein [Paenibacillus lycopersici]QHT61684.1 hypothetical protein GXP70_18035 [Paenibacillus lycopersici]
MLKDKHIGQTITIIYLDSAGKITQRRIRVDALAGGKVKAYDWDKRAPRVFVAANILAVGVGRGVG